MADQASPVIVKRSASERAVYIADRLDEIADRDDPDDKQTAELRGYAMALRMLGDDLEQLGRAAADVAAELDNLP